MIWIIFIVVVFAIFVSYKVGYNIAMCDAETAYQQKLADLYAKLLMYTKERARL